ncbi:ornithine cyclodeaminase family protein [Thermodesulfobacteriota bacterium]
MDTLIITSKEIYSVLTPSLANKVIEKAFRAYGYGKADMPPKNYLNFKHGDLRSMPAYLHGEGFNIAGIKSVNVHPLNNRKNMPTVMGLVILTDPNTGFPLAVLDGTSLTSIRTGAAGALAVKLLSNKDAKYAGFVGSGIQARTQLECIMEVRKLTGIKVWKFFKKDPSVEEFCVWAKKKYGLDTLISEDINDISMNVDIVVATTPSRTPVVIQVSPGTHINAIGADASGKQEIHPGILKKSKLVIDDWKQASHSGEINVPYRKKQIRKKDIYGELGEIAVRAKKGREKKDEITVFDSTGLAIQDVACGYAVYKELKNRKNVQKVAFF